MTAESDGANGTSAAKSPRVSRAVPLSIALVVFGAWFGWSYQYHYWAERGANRKPSYLQSGTELARYELELRAASIRRHAEKTGALPASLSDCDVSGLTILDWLRWKTDGVKALDENSFYGEPAGALTEVWVPNELLGDSEGRIVNDSIAPPPSELDFLGLPILYERANMDGDPDLWVTSSESFSPDVAAFLDASGGAAPASAEPFRLSSVFMRRNAARIKAVRLRERIAFHLLWAPSLLIIAAIVLILKRGRFRPVGIAGMASVVVAGVLGVFGIAAGYQETHVTCYVPVKFTSWFLPSEERLAILDKAVADGDVPGDVARTARAYIEKRPGGY